MKTSCQLLTFCSYLLISLINFGCQTKQEKPQAKVPKTDTIKKPLISMEDVLNDSIPMWHLSKDEQRKRLEKVGKFKYYGDIKLTRREPLSYVYRGGKGDTLITERFPSVLNHRIKVEGRYVHKIQYFNGSKEKVKEINLDDLSPFVSEKYENLVFGSFLDEDLEIIDSTGLLKPTKHILKVDNQSLPNGFNVVGFRLYSFHINEHKESRFLGFETYIKVLNSQGKVIGNKNHFGRIASWVSDDGKLLCLNTNMDSIPDEFEIFDLENQKTIFRQQARSNQNFMYLRTIKGGLVHSVNRTNKGKHLCFLDLQKKLIIEKHLSEEECKSFFEDFTSYYDILKTVPFDTIPF